MEAISVNNVTKILKRRRVLDDVSLHIPEGSITGIVGRNGSGKGSISIMGNTIGRNGAFPSDIGILIERPGFLPQYSAFQNLKMIAEIKNRINDDDIVSMMTDMGLDPKDRRPARKYSLGMKQKIGIIQAIMERPRVILLDEPTNNLDQESIVALRTILLRLRSQGSTIMLCSHNAEDISTICDRSYTIVDGRINDMEVLHV